MKMKHLKWGVALVLSLALAVPMGNYIVQAQEETVETEGVQEEQSTKVKTQTSTNNVVVTNYTTYVKVDEEITISVSDMLNTWTVDGETLGNTLFETEYADFQKNVTGMVTNNGVTVTGKKAGQGTLVRKYTDFETINGSITAVDKQDVYTIIVVDQDFTQPQNVDVILTASLKVSTRPKDYYDSDSRYYTLGTIEMTNLPAAQDGVSVNVNDYIEEINQASNSLNKNEDLKIDFTWDDVDYWYSLTPELNEDGSYSWQLIGCFYVNDLIEQGRTQNYVYTDGVENEEVFPDKTYTTIKGVSVPKYNSDGSNPTREGYKFVDWNKTVQEDGTIVYEAQWKAVEKESASLEIEFIDKDTKESVGKNQVIQSEPGIVGEEYTFVSGEYEVTIPEGYKCISEYSTVTVKYGESVPAKLYVEKITNPAQPGQEEDANNESQNGTDKKSEQTDGTNTGVAMSLAGVFGTMSIALAGMITLLKKKK